jgi:PAS domain S-box-containing protein
MNLPSTFVNPHFWILLFISAVFGCLFYFISSRNQIFRAQKWFLFYLGLLITSGFSLLLPLVDTNLSGVVFWQTVFFAINVFSFPTLLGFAIAFTGREALFDNPLVRILLYLPSVFMLFLITQTDLILYHTSYTGFAPTVGSLYLPLYFVWVQLYLVTCIGLFSYYSRKSVDKVRRRWFGVFTAVIGTQLVINLVCVFLLPEFLQAQFIDVTFSLSLLVGLGLGYGMMKYNFSSTNPATVASTIIDTMNEVLMVVDYEGKIESVEALLHYSKSEMIGKNASILFSTEDHRFTESILNPIVGGTHQIDMEANLYTKDQKKIPVKVSASAIRDAHGKLEGIVCVITDVTHLRELFAVTEQRNKMNSIIESIYDGVLAFDLENNVSMVNSSTLTMFNLRKEDIIGKRVEDFLSFMEKEQPFIISDLLPTSDIIHETLITQRKAVKTVSISGKQIYVDLTCSVMKPDSGVNLHGIITLHDLTHEKELEEMKLDFVSMAAHELRTPLTSIRGYLSVILKEFTSNLTDEQKMMLGRVSISADQLMAIVESLLSVSKIERGIFSVNISEVDWMQFVKQTVSDFQERAKERNITLRLEEPHLSVSAVAADALRIGEVLNNLLSNAINYTYPGGSVTVSLDEKDGTIVTHIKDTGQGIPKEALPHLFTKFFRVSGRLEKGSKGTGLGLYIAKYIVNLHQGEIWVDSELGKGSTFTFSLPVITEATKVLIKDSEMTTANASH